MDRRAFLRRSALVAAGTVAADQADILDRLGGWARRMFTTGGYTSHVAPGTLAGLYRKTSSDMRTAIRLSTDEYDWFKSYPRERVASGHRENRIILQLPHSALRMIPA